MHGHIYRTSGSRTKEAIMLPLGRKVNWLGQTCQIALRPTDWREQSTVAVTGVQAPDKHRLPQRPPTISEERYSYLAKRESQDIKGCRR